MKKSFVLLLTVALSFLSTKALAQSENIASPEDYYYQIPDYPTTFAAGTVAARLVDGLGFRYYWATEGLTEDNLAFKPSEEARTMRETLDHIYGLTLIVVNAAKQQPNDISTRRESLPFAEMRKQTLENIREASEILKKSSGEDMEAFMIVFEYRDGNKREYPFWNNLNGPIADALWHVGQVVSFRRSAGNPFNSNVSLMQGKVRG